MSLKQFLSFKLSQKLSPQQIQLMKLIQLPTQAFEQRLKQELEENPALDTGKESEASEDNLDEFDNSEETYDDNETIEADDINIDEYLSDDEIPEYRTQANNYSADDEDKSVPYAAGTSFTQHLTNQLNTFRLSNQEEEIAYFLVGSVDESGYIRRSLSDITDDLAFTQNVYTTEEEVEKVLQIVHQLDPAGVGARNLQECLSIQLHRKEQRPDVEMATAIIDKAFDQFTKKHYKKLMQKFNIDEEQLKDAVEQIEHLNPKPGGSYAGNNKIVQHIVPDFAIKIVNGELELTLNGRNAPELHVSREYNNMLKGYKETKEKSKSQKDAVMFIKQKLDAAKWFIEAVRQRQQTLFITMSSIMHYQKEYFLTGDERNLRPMILKDIADEIEMDVSTISRVANSKYVDTPYGTKLIKEFFSESMTNDQGEEVSTREIKKILETVIEEESKKKPLTDEALSKILKEKGYPIARRTVAKYREQLDIPVARLRKEL
ncbi:RNA polymerase factor sigma-54 [uncultured Winogradskyella sp.]|uniref:RNA polymerase factor sigma-54 n=1 Tax=uncultured Winogradskyella sp. TaxID=395353 RepID=UPI002607E36D|nr:RNA polymerase factor sigma-54 [uncultured Winogradskyella sp.]|tara:strand:- start:1913 stop:3379 length:1467 start_codon:yes stop_codon:yes gene_type:complete